MVIKIVSVIHSSRCVPSLLNFFCGAQSSLWLHLVQWKQASWTIDLIMPSYGKSEICRSCLSGPMSVSVLLASIHSAHHSNNNNLSLIFFPLQVCDYLHFGNCCTTLPHVMQTHQAFFSIRHFHIPSLFPFWSSWK